MTEEVSYLTKQQVKLQFLHLILYFLMRTREDKTF